MDKIYQYFGFVTFWFGFIILGIFALEYILKAIIKMLRK